MYASPCGEDCEAPGAEDWNAVEEECWMLEDGNNGKSMLKSVNEMCHMCGWVGVPSSRQRCNACGATDCLSMDDEPERAEDDWNPYVKVSRKQTGKSQQERKIERIERAKLTKDTNTRRCEDINMLGDLAQDESIQAVEEIWEWTCIQAAVDTACVDHVANPKDFPGLQVSETPESRRGDSWTTAGGSPKF